MNVRHEVFWYTQKTPQISTLERDRAFDTVIVGAGAGLPWSAAIAGCICDKIVSE